MHKRELMLAEKSRVEIEEKEQQLSLALWASGDVLWNWDIKGQTVSRENASSLNALPEGKVEPSWKNMQAYVHSDDFPLLLKHLQAIKNAEKDTFDVSYRVKDKAGEWAWVQDKGKVVEKDASGNPLRVAGIQHDITILKQQEVDLITLNNELEQRVKQRTQDLLEALDSLKATQQSLVEAEKMAALGVLVAGLAHELNTPLGTAITAVTNLHAELKQLNDKVETGKLTKADLTSGFDALTKSGDLILSGVQRTSSLVEQFKRVSVSERGEGLVLQSFSDLAHTAFGEAWKAAGEPANVSLMEVPATQITVYVDTLLQVLELLFSNAISHAQPADKLLIKVSLQEYDDHYEVIVEENGVGISVEEQNKVFNPFYTLARHKGHVGLGLNIVFNLVSQVLGGVIECEQSELGGAKFRFTLNKSAEEITLQTV